MKILALFSLAIVGVFLISVVDRLQPNVARPIGIMLATTLVIGGLALISPTIESLETLCDIEGYKGGVKIMLKSLGVSLASSFASDICRDYGEGTVTSAVNFIAKCELVLIAYPLWKSIVALALSMLEK